MKQNWLKKMYLGLRVFFIGFVLAGHAMAADQGGNEIAFLQVGLGARPMGMGNAYTALANDRHAVYWNPAGLVLGKHKELGSMRTKLETDFNVFYLNAKYKPQPKANETRSRSAYGVYWVHGSMDGLPLVSETEEEVAPNTDVIPEDFFNYHANAIGVAYARWISRTWAIGLNATGFHKGFSKINQGSGGGVSFTPGMMWIPDYQWAVGAVIRDVLNWQKWQTGTTEYVNPEWRGGISFAPTSFTLLVAEWRQKLKKGYAPTFHVGTEWTFLDTLRLRAGFDEDRFASGLGVYVGYLDINYAYTAAITDGLGDTHRVGIGVGL